MRELLNLSARLAAISMLVRSDVNFVDVGTDHGYLPIYLFKTKNLKKVIASDIAIGPLEKARCNILEAGLSEKIELYLSDGLKSINLASPCDIVIAGMGGELISDIISGKPEIKSSDVNLILQPMTKAEYLREFLSQNGFDIISEELVQDGKIYQIILSRYIGKKYELTDSEKLIGKEDVRRKTELFSKFVFQKIKSLRAISYGRQIANVDSTFEDKLIYELLKIV